MEAATSHAQRPGGSVGALEFAVRAGFFARAFTYAVIAGLTFALAFGAGRVGEAPNQQGALAILAHGWLGHVALIAIAVSLLAYALWKGWQAVAGRGPEGGGDTSVMTRVSNLAGAAVYIGFFVVALRVLTGTSSNSSAAPRLAAAGVLGWPGGRLLVGGAGILLLAVSIVQLYDAVRGRFLQDSKLERMDAQQRDVFLAIGRVGIGARAVVFGLVGYFVLRAAIDFAPRNAVGLDGVLARVHHQPYGPLLLVIVAVGLLTFAVFSLAEGRYRRL
jgi:Domain of Unknown Function (DUF1206)